MVLQYASSIASTQLVWYLSANMTKHCSATCAYHAVGPLVPGDGTELTSAVQVRWYSHGCLRTLLPSESYE